MLWLIEIKFFLISNTDLPNLPQKEKPTSHTHWNQTLSHILHSSQKPLYKEKPTSHNPTFPIPHIHIATWRWEDLGKAPWRECCMFSKLHSELWICVNTIFDNGVMAHWPLLFTLRLLKQFIKAHLFHYCLYSNISFGLQLSSHTTLE